MARLEEMPEWEREYLSQLPCPSFDNQPWVTGPPLSERRVAMITTAGLQRRGELGQAAGGELVDDGSSRGPGLDCSLVRIRVRVCARARVRIMRGRALAGPQRRALRRCCLCCTSCTGSGTACHGAIVRRRRPDREHAAERLHLGAIEAGGITSVFKRTA